MVALRPTSHVDTAHKIGMAAYAATLRELAAFLPEDMVRHRQACSFAAQVLERLSGDSDPGGGTH